MAESVVIVDETPIKVPVPERRHRAVRVGQRTVMELIMLSGQQTPEYLLKFHCDDLPAGYVLEYVLHDQYARVFLFIVSHPSFDPVPEGCPAPLHCRTGGIAWSRHALVKE